MRAPAAGALAIVFIAIACPLAAQSPASAHFVIDRWNTETGLPQNSVNAILQSRDGYLWLATLGGVARFDGTSFFALTTRDHPELRSDRVRALAQDRAGRIWIGTEEGLSRYDHNHLRTYTADSGLPARIVTALAPAADGSIWFGTNTGALGKADASQSAPVQR